MSLRRTYRWGIADWIRWFVRQIAPWLLLGLTLGAIATTACNLVTP